MPKLVDITGQRFGRLVVLGRAERDENKRTRWRARCDCGSEKVVDGAHMRYGRIRSCGCLSEETSRRIATEVLPQYSGHNRTHGMSRTPVYAVWKAMHERCRNPNCRDYRWYGQRGIRVCERWSDFAAFYADMGDPPAGYTIDRIDVDGHYEPLNCRWADWETQRANKRVHH
jgi:hypothetical protein